VLLRDYKDKGIGNMEIGEVASVVPRYSLAASYSTKAVRINSALDHIITAFSKEKNIFQREMAK